MKTIIPPVRVVRLFARDDGKCDHLVTLLTDMFERRGVRVTVDNDPKVPTVDLIVALGGDGTLLRAAKLAGSATPVVGINGGTLGFLAAYSPTTEDLSNLVRAASVGYLEWEPRLRLEVDIDALSPEGRLVAGGQHFAYNDVVVTNGPRMLRFETWVSNAKMSTVKGGGLIVATPMGSTAYNLSAGGPIVSPDTDALVVTPITPQGVTHRPVVLSARSRVMITSPDPVDTGHATVTIDGQSVHTLKPGERLHICASARPFKLVAPTCSVFTTLADKFGFNRGEQ